jgi:peptidoglycan/xylan/chitin deacetylase (PgdA/CDA1 family)
VKRVLSAFLVLAVLTVAGFLLLRESSGAHTRPAAAEPSVASAAVTTEVPPATTITSTAVPTSTTTTTSTATTTSTLGSIPAGAPDVIVSILMYHYVDASPPAVGPYADGLTVRTADFEAEMAILESGGYHTVSFDQVWQAMAGRTPLPSKPVLLTFDDGGRDNYTVAFPILKRHGLVATFFVITNAVGTNPQSMTWAQLREMKAAGMTIGSHTKRHPDLRTISPDRLWDELAGSRAVIEAELGAAPDVLSYPSGRFTAKIAKLASTAGYRMAVTTRWGRTVRAAGMLEMPRMRVLAHLSVAAFQLELQ